MSRAQFDDECPGCRPAIIRPDTGEVLPEDDPTMVKVNAVWATTTLDERSAFHRVCCLNSRTSEDMTLMQGLMKRMEVAVKAS